jgi:iron complex outermembrane recepter protein
MEANFMRLVCVSLCLLVMMKLAAQTQNSIPQFQVQVKDSLKQGIEGAVVELLNKDAKLVKVLMSDKEGTTEAISVPEGTYSLVIVHLNYERIVVPVELQHTGSTRIIEVLLSMNVKTLSDVAVTSRKPLIERKLDKLIVNVENSIVSSGSSALEVLEKSPGVVVDQNENISLKGKQGVILMIDGKLSPLSGSDLATMLRGLPSSAVERIEIMTNPSAKYDAAGNSGIINLVLKKDKKLGTNGTITAGVGQGIYHRRNGGISFNHRNKKVNFFGNYNYAARTFFNDLSIERSVLNNGQPFEEFRLLNKMVYFNSSHTYRAGADYFLSKRTTIGVLINGFINGMDKKVDNSSEVASIPSATKSRFSTNSVTEEQLKHYSVNVNVKYLLDSMGQEITIDLDNATYDRNSEPRFTTRYYDNSAPKPNFILNGYLASDLNIWAAKADYVKPIGKSMRFEAGFKTSFVQADNDLQFYDVSGSLPVSDHGRSNHFLYDENINALYGTISLERERWSIKAGLRAEHANIHGIQRANSHGVDTSYLRLFPSTFFNYKLAKNHEVGMSYSRRIRRPTYSQLNPFQSFIDLTSFNAGNPYLRPQFTDNYEVSYTFAQHTTFTLGYARDHDVITWIILPKNTSAGTVSVETFENIKSADYFGLSISNQKALTKWWNTSTNIDIFKMNFDGVIANTSASNTGIVVQGNSTQSFIFPKRWSSELTLNYQGPEQTPFAFSKAQWMLSAGLQKVIFDGKGTMRLNVADIFRTYFPGVTSEFVDYRQYFTAARDTRTVSLNFSYRFGKTTVANARRRVTGVEDEKNRAQ